ncbi:MAG: DUF6017 domain-containing protein [Lachnospiraceae bacterium]|nr:DUF6017 domain-containing protein [Lachnospiraceae bacterium]MCQ2526990.1 DUF6017 domain-containing protein [Lachnospiraceae bacterium]
MKLAYSTGNAIVDEVSEMNFSGNVVPLTWFKTMLGESGKPMLLAIDLLADIVYWYRPKEIRDEGTGDLIGFQKRFKADLLQRSYRQIEQRFGVTKKQARTALDYLCKIGVIRKHLRNELTSDGTPLHNNMYLELVPEKLKELTYPQFDDDVPLREPPSANEDTRVVTCKTDGGALNVTTSTETTTEINNINNNNHINTEPDVMETMRAYEKIIKKNIEYEILVQYNNGIYRKNIDEIVILMVETVSIPRKYIYIGGTRFPYEIVKSQFLKLNYEHILYVITCMKDNTTKVKNIRSYLLTTLYNAPNTIDSYYQAEVNHDLHGGL